jgi:hypothetical protein
MAHYFNSYENIKYIDEMMTHLVALNAVARFSVVEGVVVLCIANPIFEKGAQPLLMRTHWNTNILVPRVHNRDHNCNLLPLGVEYQCFVVLRM